MSGTSYRANRYSDVMNQHLTVVYESAEECMCGCPFCDGKNTLGFNDVKGLWICFKCGERGTAKTLVEKLDGRYTEPEIDLEALGAELRLLECDVQQVQSALPESYLRRFSRPGWIHESWRARGFDESLCDRWELGHDFLTDRLTIPFRDPFTRSLSGVIYRSLGNGNGPRYQYPKGFPRSRSLYGSWFVPGSGTKHVVLVEGPGDAIKVSRTADLPLAQYGSSIGQGQVQLLHRLGVEAATLFYDYDRAGLQATKKAQEALGSEILVEKVIWNQEKYCWHRRVCDCPKQPHQLNLGPCQKLRWCDCKRIHEPDPGQLRDKEISIMLLTTEDA